MVDFTKSSLFKTIASDNSFFLIFSLFGLMTIMTACGNSSSQGSLIERSSETGAYSCSLLWPEDVPQLEGSTLSVQAVNCESAGISKVRFSFYDENNNALVEDSWDCNDHLGTIEGIPVGENRKLICTAEDADNQILYRAIEPGITIEKGKITQGGEIALASYTAVYDQPTLIAPQDETTVDGTPVAFSWSPVDGASEYELTISSVNDFSTNIFNAGITAVSYNYSDALSDGTYYWRVRCRDDNLDVSDWSEVWSFNIFQAQTAPDAPENVTVSQGNGFLTLSWDPTAGAESYNIYWYNSSDVSTTRYNEMIEDVNAASYLHTDLVNESTYYYVVTAENSYGESPASTVVSGTPTEALTPLLEQEGTFSQSGDTEYYQVTMAAGQDLFVKLSYSYQQNYYLYVRFGSPPTSQIYDVSSTTGDDQLAVVHNTRAGVYYIMAYAQAHFSDYSGDFILTVYNSLETISVGSQIASLMTNFGQKHYYQIPCSTGQNLFVKLDYSYQQNYYLFLKYGTPPTQNDFDDSSTTSEDQLAVVQNTQAGIYYAMVYSQFWSASYSDDYTISARSSFDSMTVNVPIISSFSNFGQKHYYQIEATEGENLFINLDYDYRQNYHLYASHGAPPTRDDFDFSSTTGDDELISIENTQAGVYYIMVYSQFHSGSYSNDYTLTATNSF